MNFDTIASFLAASLSAFLLRCESEQIILPMEEGEVKSLWSQWGYLDFSTQYALNLLMDDPELKLENFAWYEECAEGMFAFFCYITGAMSAQVPSDKFLQYSASLPSFAADNEAMICENYHAASWSELNNA